MLPRHFDTVQSALAWLQRQGARGLTADSRRVTAGDAFIAWPGYAHDARQYVGAALQAGAVACLVEADGVGAHGLGGEARVASVRGLKAATGPLASLFFGEPSHQLDVIAVTGTNGKTSTAWWTAQAASALGRRCGVVGTLGIGEPPRGETPSTVEATGLTTPDPITLQAAFRRFVDQGFAACAIEASSIGLAEDRLAGTRIAVAQFTNFTQDHLDYHQTMTQYRQAKQALFDWPGLRAAVLNLDDEAGATLAGELRTRALDVRGYSLLGEAGLTAKQLRYVDGGLAFELNEGGDMASVRTALIGDYNASNLLAVIGALRALGLPLQDIAGACAQLTPVPGRMQRVAAKAGALAPEVVVDYAHTPDALEKALLALRPFATQRGGKLWCVFGCGGDRDPMKRPMMGAIAERLADHVVATSDNPRGEAPGFILSQILAGVIGHDDVDVIEDRAEAIGGAIADADARDVILIAGKGHEDYQELAGVKRPFSDVAQAQAALAGRSQP